jgi:hypothetical protein
VAPRGASTGAFAPRSVAAGTAGNGAWTPAFKIEREEGATGLAYLAAQQRCIGGSMTLCTETQWERACGEDPAIGGTETWTLSASADGFVVRGGANCSARQVQRGGETSQARATVCCERAVGIRTGNKNDAFLKSSAKRVLDLERANNRRDVATLGGLYDEQVEFLGRTYARADLLKEAQKYFRQFPDQWLFYDTCDTRIDKGAEVTLVSDCVAVGHRGGEVAVVIQQIVHGGPESHIQKLSEPRTIRKYSPP